MLKYRKGIFKIEQTKSFDKDVWIIHIMHEKAAGAFLVPNHFTSEQEAVDYIADHTNLVRVSDLWFDQCKNNRSKRPK